MKVALVSEWLDSWRGGAETSTQQFIHHLMDRGVELHVFTRSRPSPTPGMFVHTISGASMSRTRRSVTFSHRVEHILRTDSFDVVHAISPCRFADIYQPRGGTVAETMERNVALRDSAHARRLKRYTARLNLKQRYQLLLERKLLAPGKGPVVAAISDYVVRQLKQHYDLPDERIRRIYNGVDADRSTQIQRAVHRQAIRREFGIAPSDVLVLLVAHNFRLKGIHRWMQALASLLERGVGNVRSLVVGRGESPRWHRLAARLDIENRLTFVGPSERVGEFLHAADILVHPTYYDPCSRVVLEGMVAGVPCITTRWDGASEMIVDGTNGYVLDEPTDLVALAERVEQLCDAGLRKRIGQAASAVADRVSMSRHACEMMALYEEVQSRELVRR
jgi:UDP-glucose:(heptosyl)LPS alpha-1,3-glucosyltransferase